VFIDDWQWCVRSGRRLDMAVAHKGTQFVTSPEPMSLMRPCSGVGTCRWVAAGVAWRRGGASERPGCMQG
jgi:hypothetical protein